MQVGDEVERLAIILQLDELVHRPVVVAHVEPARGLDAGENTRARVWGCIGGFRNHFSERDLLLRAAGLKRSAHHVQRHLPTNDTRSRRDAQEARAAHS